MQLLHWNVVRGADGQRVCRPPEGEAWVEVRERERPLVPFRVMVERRIAALRAEGVTGIAAAPAERLVTAEGEHAAIATITGDGLEHTLAVVYTDEFQMTIDGRGAPEVVREIAVHAPVALGELRTRRYLYQRPAGWRAVADGLVTTWHAPDDTATIKVLPARPLRRPAGVLELDTALHDDSFASFVHEARIQRGDGDFGDFTAVITRAVGRFGDGPRRMLITAAMTDGRFIYGLRLDTGEANAEAHETLFLALVKSCEPVPTPRPAPARDAFAHWTE